MKRPDELRPTAVRPATADEAARLRREAEAALAEGDSVTVGTDDPIARERFALEATEAGWIVQTVRDARSLVVRHPREVFAPGAARAVPETEAPAGALPEAVAPWRCQCGVCAALRATEAKSRAVR
jgi:hypothetical protein